MPGWTTVKPWWPGWSSYWCLRCCSSWLTSWLPVLSGFSDPWYLTLAGDLSVWGEGAFWDPSQAVHAWKACFAATEMSTRTCTSWLFYFCFWYRTQQFPFKKKKNLTRAHHCHDSWGFSLSTVVIFRLLVVFLYLFLNILCGILSGICLWVWISVSKLVVILNVTNGLRHQRIKSSIFLPV